MTLSIREQVLQAFKTRLTAIGGGVTVARNLDDAVSQAQASIGAVIMEDGGDARRGGSTGDGETFGLDTYDLHVTVWGYLSAPTDEALGTAISDLKAKIVVAVCADRTLAGTAQYLREVDMADPQYDHDDGRRPNAAIEVHFSVEYITAPGNPYVAP